MDMDKYISNRRTREDERPKMRDKITNLKYDMSEWNLFSMFKKKRKTTPYMEDDDDDDDEYVEEEVEIEAINDVEDELDRERESALKRFFKKFRFKQGRRARDDMDDEDELYENNANEFELEEIKEVIKITHKWLEQLPPETIERFKRSEDFQKYKEILKKLEMIK